jgi:hypothetical protein
VFTPVEEEVATRAACPHLHPLRKQGSAPAVRTAEANTPEKEGGRSSRAQLDRIGPRSIFGRHLGR